MTKEDFIATVVANHKSNKWLSCTIEVEGINVSVKAFGKWVQRMEANCKPYWSGAECKTVSTFKEAVRTGLEYCLAR